MKTFSSSLEAIALMLLSMACFATMAAFIRLLSYEMHSTQMVFLRNICSLVIVLAWEFSRTRRLPTFPTTRLRSHFWRGSVGFVAMELWFYGLTLMPLDLATALSFTTPIFSTIFAIFCLGERAGMHRWSAIAIGLLGVVVILHPDTGGMDWKAAFVLGSSALMGITGVMVKGLTRTEPPETIVFYMALFMIPWSAIPASMHWQAFTAHEFWLVFLIALFSTAAHLLIARAYIRADMVMLMPFDFTRLVFTAFLAYFMFGETVSGRSFAGAAIIVASSVSIAHREARWKKIHHSEV